MAVAANKLSRSQPQSLSGTRSQPARARSMSNPQSSLGNHQLQRMFRSAEHNSHSEATPPATAGPVVLAKKAVSGPGIPLSSEVQQEAGALYGQNFSDVRIHTDNSAADATRALRASAFTLGHDIAFAPGRYGPDKARGRLLLHHELRHVAQQRSATPVAVPKIDSADSGPEREARELLNPGIHTVSVQRIQCAPEDEQYSLSGGLVDRVGSGAFGERAWPFMKAVLEGFVGGARADVKSGRGKAATEHIMSLITNPWALAKYYGGFLIGLVIGLVSPITDLIKGVIGLIQLAISATEWLAKWSPVGVAISPERRDKIARLYKKFAELQTEFIKAMAEFVADPRGTIRKFSGFLDDMMQMALAKAREIGSKAAHAIFDFLELPYYEMGKSIGEVIGVLLAQVLLLVFTDAIGNVVAKGASFLGKAAEFIAGKAVQVFEWVKGFVSEVFAILRNAVRGALKLFRGLITRAVEAFESLGALFTEAASVELGAEKVAAGVGTRIPGPAATNVLESRMVSATRTSPAKVSDLRPPKVHPSNVAKEAELGKEASQGRKISDAAKQSAATQYRDNLVNRFPKLKQAELQPIKRPLGEPGLWEESVYTGSGERSWSARMRDGTKIQIDDIDQVGTVVDTKMRGLRAGLEIPSEAEADVVTQISGGATKRSYAAFAEKEQSKLLKQLRFARENELKGVRWETNDPALFREVQRYRATVLTDAEQKLFRIILVER